MYSPAWFTGKRVTVMGLGLLGGGLGAAKWLLKHGSRLTITDKKTEAELRPSLRRLEAYAAGLVRRGMKPEPYRLVLGRHDEADFREADLIIRNPAVPRDHELLALAARAGVPVETDVSLFCLMCPFPIAAVTGTKGKTTVTTLLWKLAAAADRRTVVGGNIRISPLDALDRIIAESKKRRPRPMPVILELSSWQLESLEPHRWSPAAAVITNVLPDHLNRYKGMDDYAAAKELNVRFQKAGDAAVLNWDDPRVRAMGDRLMRLKTKDGRRKTAGGGPEVLWFSTRRLPVAGCGVRRGRVVFRRGGRTTDIIAVRDIKLPGEHNLYNILAAAAAATAMNLPLAVIRRGLKAFTGAPGRLEVLGQRGGLTFVNDTTATMPDASVAAIKAMTGRTGRRRVVLLAGGADKELLFGDWAKAVARSVKTLVLFEGTARMKIEAALAAAGSRVPVAAVGSMPAAVQAAVAAARRGDIVLLSPACASFGLFRNEFDRGDRFVAEVKKIIKGRKG